MISYINIFFGNYWLNIPNSNYQFLLISKNACTELKSLALYNLGYDISNLDIYSTHNTLVTKFRYLLSETPHKDKIKIAVYRDPVDRIKSIYTNYVLDQKLNKYFYYTDVYSMNFSRFMEFVKLELGKSGYLKMDEHIRPMSGYINDIHDPIWVDISNLSELIHNINPSFKITKMNKSRSSINISIFDRIKIKRLYKNDYRVKNLCTEVF